MTDLQGSIIAIRLNGSLMTDFISDPKYRSHSAASNKPLYTAKQLAISSRVLAHWDEMGILPSKVKTGGVWRKFSFVERVWMGVATKLRDYGYPLEQISNVRKQVLRYSPSFKGYVHFEFFTMRAFFSSDDPYVMVLPDGSADIATSAEIELWKMTNKKEAGSMLLISLKEILRGFGYDVPTPESLYNLSKEEQKVLEHLRLNGNDEVSAKIKDGRVSEVQTTQIKQGGVALNDTQKSIETNKDFAQVIANFQAGQGETTKIIKKYRTR